MTSDPPAADIHGRDFRAGAAVLEEGDPGNRMYVPDERGRNPT
jgi:hypothetical protein